MAAFDKKVNQIAARHGWNISPVSGWYIPAYSIVPMDRKERDQITAALNRCKSFHVDVLQAFSACAWTCTILIRDRAEWEALQEHQHTADLIRNAFIEAYHFNGHDSRGAASSSRHGKAAHGKRATKKEVGAAAGRVYLFFRVILPGRSFFRGVVRGGRLESIAGHSFPRGVHNIPRHAFPGVGGGCVQILFNFFRDSN